ncbi:hypothetical protein ACFPRL_23230 [Pseudoclavibacter helvolus]
MPTSENRSAHAFRPCSTRRAGRARTAARFRSDCASGSPLRTSSRGATPSRRAHCSGATSSPGSRASHARASSTLSSSIARFAAASTPITVAASAEPPSKPGAPMPARSGPPLSAVGWRLSQERADTRSPVTLWMRAIDPAAAVAMRSLSNSTASPYADSNSASASRTSPAKSRLVAH